jgi:hypothetical protein
MLQTPLWPSNPTLLAIEIGHNSRSDGGVHHVLANDGSKINDRQQTVGITGAQPADKAMFLRQGGVTVGVAILSVLLMQQSCNCVINLEPQSVHQWLLMAIAMMCLPFGILLLVICVVIQLCREATPPRRKFTPSSRAPR